MRTILIILAVVILGIVIGVRAQEGPKTMPFEEKTKEGLELKCVPVLEEDGIPKAISGMIVNGGTDTILVKTYDVTKGGFRPLLSVEIGPNDEMELETKDRKTTLSPKPKERTYVLEPNAFVGVMMTLSDDSRKHLKPGKVLNVTAVAKLRIGQEESRDEELRNVTLTGSVKFIVPYPSKRKGK